MAQPRTFQCSACGETLLGGGLSRHLAEREPERVALFERFVADHPEDRLRDTHCSGKIEILPLMDHEEQERFGVTERSCGSQVMGCGCGGSFCVHHTFSCDTCGRFACLRHRFSGTCPGCTRAGGARPVKVEKYDPFSKQRSTFVRTYRRNDEREVWDAVAHPDDV